MSDESFLPDAVSCQLCQWEHSYGTILPRGLRQVTAPEPEPEPGETQCRNWRIIFSINNEITYFFVFFHLTVCASWRGWCRRNFFMERSGRRAGPMGAEPGWGAVFSPFTHTGGWSFTTLVTALESTAVHISQIYYLLHGSANERFVP